MLKVLYLGQLIAGATSEMRYRHLMKLGHDVLPLNMDPSQPASKYMSLVGRISWRLGWPLDYERLNAQVLKVASEFQPDVLWVDKGIRISKSTLNSLRLLVKGVRLVHYNPDDPFGHAGRSGWRRFIDAMPAYDVHFVPRNQNVHEYEQRGCQTVIHNIPTRGFDPEVHKPYTEPNEIFDKLVCDVGFLGAYERERGTSLLRLAKEGFKIRLMTDWPDSCWHANFKRSPFQVRGAEYAKALSSFKIGLGFLRKANRDQHTSRSIEIPACGTFLLAERTAEHQMLFEEGKEADFFSSDDELVAKVKYYLENDKVREKIAQAGRERCVRSGYDYSSRMQQMLSQVLASKPQC